jgi:hypothetical protein
MAQILATDLLADVILVVMALECVALIVYWRLTRRGVAPSDFALNLMSGFCLALALRAALGGVWWGWIAACLGLAGLAHALDLMTRWRRGSA